MTGNGNRERVGDGLRVALLIFIPCGQRQSYPNRAAVDQKLNIHCVSMASGNGNNQGLVDAVDLLLGPAIEGLKVAIHGSKTISNWDYSFAAVAVRIVSCACARLSLCATTRIVPGSECERRISSAIPLKALR